MDKKLNICLITSSYLPLVGGRELVVHNLAVSLKNMGHNVTVFVPFSKQRKNKKIYPYRIVQFGFRGSGRFGLMIPCMYIMLLYIIYRYKIDVVNIHGIYQSRAFQFLKLFKRIPVIGTPHGDDVQVFPDLNYGVRLDPKNDRIVRRSVNLCDRVTAISRSIREHLAEILEDKNRIVDIPNGIWTSTFHNVYDKKVIRADYKVSDDATILISVGRNHPVKGFLVGVEALAKLKEKGFNVIYLIVGRGMSSLREKAYAMGASDILFTPGQLATAEVIKLFQASDIYISPSFLESFGITTIEAMCAGLPCVVTDIKSSRDIVTTRFGMFTKPGDAQGLADAVQKLLQDPLLMERMGKEAQAESQKYDWNEVAPRYVQVYIESIEALKYRK